jgi:hypothetical protein
MKRLTNLLWLPLLLSLQGCPQPQPIGNQVPFPPPAGTVDDPNTAWATIRVQLLGKPIAGQQILSEDTSNPTPSTFGAGTPNQPLLVVFGANDLTVGLNSIVLDVNRAVCNPGSGGPGNLPTIQPTNVTASGPTRQTVLAFTWSPHVAQDMGAFGQIDYALTVRATTAGGLHLNTTTLFYSFSRSGQFQNTCLPAPWW